MSRATRLADHIERTVTGPMWHGPALLEALKGVACDQALARPLPDAHTIWEVVLHVTAWCDIARQRLEGQATAIRRRWDWPAVRARCRAAGARPARSASEWRRASTGPPEPSRPAADTRRSGGRAVCRAVPG